LPYVSRGGEKLAAALDHFRVDVTGLIAADLGSHVGGFVDCLLQRGAAKVYSVDTSYGTLAWRLRKNPRVVVLERTNAMHVTLPEPVDLVTIDVGWTPQTKILPQVARLLAQGAKVVALIKPHYEAAADLLVDGVLPEEQVDAVVQKVVADIASLGWELVGVVESPIRGHGGNREMFVSLTRVAEAAQ
jgi:23S rRNA (cytidine1920-2'-O)/16S rRNA (cytidine1409-2'-O)-methyltransferase